MSGIDNLVKAGELTVGNKIARESISLIFAECVSIAAMLGVVAEADKVAPELTEGATKAIAKAVVEPNLDVIEKSLTTVCKLETCKPDKEKNREQRSHDIARMTVLFGAAWVPSLLIKLATRRGMNKVMGIGDEHQWWDLRKLSPTDKSVAVWDEGVHYGSLILANTLLAKPSDEMIRGVSGILQKTFGWSKQRSDETAVTAVIHEVPNLMGAAAGILAIAAHHSRAKV
ncbi:MAG: hypothetical protein EBR02_01350 [Alphaproteobacteria bacterium]|nr:hypothetical protein [Alphaproteobacteria bacterium]